MNERIDDISFVKIETQGFYDLCDRIKKLENENEFLKEHNEALQSDLNRTKKILEGVKLNNGKITLERNNLIEELQTIKNMSMFEFGNRYCSDESLASDGKAFAKALLGGY